MDSVRTNKPLMHSLLVLGISLGSGTFGTVYEARWGNQPCAAKTFFGSQSDFHHDAIQKEISLLQSLRHRHVIQFYRTHEEDGRIYLLMELAEKGSLARAINKGELTPDDWAIKKRLASEIARGLAFIHQENVFHRDLKSANVLLTRHMEVKLADFGLAKVRSMTSAASAASSGAGLKGTLRWIAPELLYDNSREYSTKSDVYALGMVMWEMAANCTRPFKDQENDSLVALNVYNGSRERVPEDTPIEYRRWVKQCWHQDPQQRPEANEVVLIYDEPVSECSGTAVGSTVDLGSSHSGWDHSASKLGDHKGTLDAKAIHDDTEQHVGQLPPTDDDVVAHLSMSAQRGSVDAQLFLGWIYAHGRGIDKNERDSLWWYQQAAHQGSAVAQIRVGMMYEEGQGVDASDEKAASWYRRGANSGSAEAQYRLGRMYGDGRGVEQNDTEAVRWYHRAAEEGQREAQVTLGGWYSLGRGVKQSDVKAFKWYIKAAEQGDTATQVYVGVMYESGQGVEQSYVEAVKWYIKAAEQGDVTARFKLEVICQPERGDEQSNFEVVKWFAKAAEQGDSEAQRHLGVMYKQGHGVKQSYVKAVKWWIRAAEQGDKKARYELDIMCQPGQGDEQSKFEAVKWFTKAGERGDATAQHHFGMDSVRTNKPLVHSLLVLGKSLGSRARGSVHEARWGNQPCAAKILFGSPSDFHHNAIQKEIAFLQSLRYRHVIQFYRTHEEDGRIYLLMELAEKGSLKRAISNGELAPDDWATKKRLASEIARGLAFIHQEYVLHRDLKSANVLLTNRMEVKLAEFGLAKMRTMTSAASAASSGAGPKGTLRWIAPELLFATRPIYSTKSDVYALGVVMWEMAANCTRPFKNQDDDALVALDIRNGSREQLPEDTPIEYRCWVKQCWHQDPQQRPEANDVVLIHDEPVSE